MERTQNKEERSSNRGEARAGNSGRRGGNAETVDFRNGIPQRFQRDKGGNGC